VQERGWVVRGLLDEAAGLCWANLAAQMLTAHHGEATGREGREGKGEAQESFFVSLLLCHRRNEIQNDGSIGRSSNCPLPTGLPAAPPATTTAFRPGTCRCGAVTTWGALTASCTAPVAPPKPCGTVPACWHSSQAYCSPPAVLSPPVAPRRRAAAGSTGAVPAWHLLVASSGACSQGRTRPPR